MELRSYDSAAAVAAFQAPGAPDGAVNRPFAELPSSLPLRGMPAPHPREVPVAGEADAMTKPVGELGRRS
jgi:hypothetical protein